MNDAISFFKKLYAGQTGVLELRTFDHPDANKLRRFLPVVDGEFSETDVQIFLTETEKRRLGAFFGVALRTEESRRTKKGDGAHCQVLTALFVDADFKHLGEEETRKRIYNFPIKPSFTIESGGGLHPYWLISQPFLLQMADGMKAAKTLLRQMASSVADVVDESVSEPVRVLRIPGSFNFKYDPPRPVLWVAGHGDVYSEGDLLVHLPPPPVEDTNTKFVVPDEVKKGDRHGLLFALLRSQKARGLSMSAALAACHAENEVKCNPPIPFEVLDTYLRRCWNQQDRPGFVQNTLAIDEVIEELNKKYAIISIGNKVVVMENDNTGSIVELWPFDEFRRRLVKEKVVIQRKSGKNGTKETKESLSDLWLESPKGRAYDRLVYGMPGSTAVVGPMDYNGWLGYTVAPTQGTWERNKQHMKDIICDGSQEYFDWVFNWLAAMVQYPGRHAMSAIVLRGGQGVGKGHFAHQMVGKLFHPQQYLHILGSNQLTAEFNEHLSGKVYVFADESTWGGDPRAAGKLKGMITEDTIPIHRKFLKMVEEASALHIIIASNNEWPIPVEKDDRRVLVLDVSSKHRQSDQYFGPLREELYSGGQQAFLYDLLAHKIDWHSLRHPPMTEAKRQVSLLSFSVTEQWWYEKLRSGQLGNADWPESVIKTAFHEDYIQYITTHHKEPRGGRSSETELGIFLSKRTPVHSQRKMVQGERREYVTLPSLAECRAHWVETNNWPTNFNWEADI